MFFETVDYQRQDGVSKIVLQRPDYLNAFNDQMIKETIEAFQSANKDAEVHAVVITGAGRAFSAGQDIKDAKILRKEIDFGDHLRQGYNELIKLMTAINKPIIAGVNGVAAGAGCGIALAADIRIASHKASFMLAFSRLGLIPDCGLTWLLPRLIGYGRAFELAVTAEKITAEKALSWGLVNQVVPHEQHSNVLRAWANSLASGPSLAIGLTKHAMQTAASQTLAEALENEARLQQIAGQTKDFQKGVSAFHEKRNPNFKSS